MRIIILSLFFCFLISKTSAQVLDYGLDFESTAQLYSGERSPFWMHSNKYGRLDEKTQISGLVSPRLNLNLGADSYFEVGAGVLYKNGFENGLSLDEAYFTYVTKNLGVTVGKKHKEDAFQGLSASPQGIHWSLNAPAIPGFQIFTPGPVLTNDTSGFGFEASLEEYIIDDDRYVEDTRLHHKSFHFVYRGQNNFGIKMGVQHYVQWAGTSPTEGPLPDSFKDYLRIVFAKPSDDVGDQEVNALGNQLGSYEVEVDTKIKELDFRFIYNHIFEDASGMKMGNLPDGRYAVYVEDNRDTFWGTPWVRAFIYEFYYTKNQSRRRAGSLIDGADNYFNNNLYRSGWTYKNRIIGMPFILLNENRFRIGTNIVAVHHVGIKGRAFDKFPYRFLLSYRQNYGVKGSFFPQKREIFSTFLEFELINSDYQLDARIGADINTADNSNFGIGLNFTKSFF